jgi:RHS repeat-associated protein
MNKLAVALDGTDIAGSELHYDGLQIADATLLGVSASERISKWKYDLRSRLAASLAASTKRDAEPTADARGAAKEQLSPADFRKGQERTPQLDAPTREAILARGSDPGRFDPPSINIDERAGGGHKIDAVIRGASVRPFQYNASEVVDDGRFLYEFDYKGRLIHATEKTASSTKRRIAYFYSGPGRLIGRRAEYTSVTDPQPQDWRLEDRTYILKADGLPADVTFVWDAVTDRIVTVARAAATSADIHGGILKQIIHGGLGYDDPIETATTEFQTQGEVKRLYPVYDEAGAGALQAIIDQNGKIVARNIATDPFGGGDVAIAGPAIDQVTVAAKKSQEGALESVTVTMRSTETLAAATVQAGSRLAAVDNEGRVIRTSTVTPTLVSGNAFAVTWKLTPAEWSALTANDAATPVNAISIAATHALRATAWGNVPMLAAPEWAVAARPVLSSPTTPIEVRESLDSLATFITNVPGGTQRTNTLYEVETLALTASTGGGEGEQAMGDLFAARMHAHPFTEPVTRLNYVRARWYDPTTGSWLSPDPLGYRDSSNLYAFAGGDPVNGRDPSGEVEEGQPPSLFVRAVVGVIQTREKVEDCVAGLGQGVLGSLTLNAPEITRPKPEDTKTRRACQVLAASAVQFHGDYNSTVGPSITSTGAGLATSVVGEVPGGVLISAGVVQRMVGVHEVIGSGLYLASAVKAGTGTPSRGGAGSSGSPQKKGGAEPVRIGQSGEEVGTEISGLPKNTRRIPSASQKRAYRVPDHMDKEERFIQEDKATKKQHLSSQLLDDKAHVLRDFGSGLVDVLIDELTEITRPLLREHLNPGSPIKLKSAKLKK